MVWPENACWWWDATISKEVINDAKELESIMSEYFSKFGWQEEIGEKNGFNHFQFRGKLIKKMRKTDKILMDCHWSVTVTENIDNWSYLLKAPTRIEGTQFKSWCNVNTNEKGQYIARQYRIDKETLRPFQRTVSEYVFDKDTVNVIIDKQGGIGKSTIAHFTRLNNNGIVLPVCNDPKELVQACQNMLSGKNLREKVVIICDLPKATNKDKLFGLYTAIEQIKSGYVVDMRNKLKEWDFDSPTMWVFTNDVPDMTLLTSRRWKLWEVCPITYQLINYGNDPILTKICPPAGSIKPILLGGKQVTCNSR